MGEAGILGRVGGEGEIGRGTLIRGMKYDKHISRKMVCRSLHGRRDTGITTQPAASRSNAN